MGIKEYAKALAEANPVIRDVISGKETVWINERLLNFDIIDGLCQLVVSDEDISKAEERLNRFAPYIKMCFPETEETGGLIESPLREISSMKSALENEGADRDRKSVV